MLKHRKLQKHVMACDGNDSYSSVTEKTGLAHYPGANTLSNGFHNIQEITHYPISDAWVSRPERPKGAKDEVKWPEGPPTRSRGPEGS